MIKRIKAILPWQIKFLVKYILVRIPGLRTYLHKFQIFSFGKMTNPDYAINVFHQHYDRVKQHLHNGYTLLELGPGDSIATAIIAKHYEATRSTLVDIDDYATKDIKAYNAVAQKLLKGSANLHPFGTFKQMLDATCAKYMTKGLTSMKQIPDESIDFIFSHAVLEHVTLDEFEDTIRETYRVQTSGGVCSHSVDLRDHLDNSLHSLRFSGRTWHAMMSRAGSYTNRLRSSQIVDIFEASGYEILDIHTESWDTLPIEKERLHTDFRQFSEDELRVWGVTIVGRKP